VRRLALLLVIAGCGGTSAVPAKPGGDTPPPPSAVATCDAAAAHLATMPRPTDAQGDPVETARANCASQPWEQPLIDCVAATDQPIAARTALATAS